MRSIRLSAALLLRGGTDSLLLLGLLWGSVLCFSTSFELNVDSLLLSLGILALGLTALLLYSLPPRLGAPGLLAVSLAWGWGVRALWDTLYAGQAAIQCAVVNLYAKAFPVITPIAPVMELPEREWTRAVTLTVLFAAALLAAVLGLLLVRLRTVWPVLILTALPLLPGLCITLTPRRLPLMVLLGCWCVLLLTSLVRKRDPDGAAVLTAAALPAAAVLLGLLTVLLPGEEYRQPGWARSARKELVDSLSGFAMEFDLSGRLPGPLRSLRFTAAGSTSTIDMAAAGAQAYDGHTVLRITTDYVGKLYLRGHSAAVYEDNLWKPLGSAWYDALLEEGALPGTGYSPLNLPAQTMPDAPYYAFEVENVSAPGGCVYFPYQLLTRPSELRGALLTDDAYIARDRFVSRHTVYFRPAALDLDRAGSSNLPGESRYRQFVYDHYLQLPDGYGEALAPHAAAVWQRLYAPFASSIHSALTDLSLTVSPEQAAQAVAEYLEELAEYDLNAPAVPEGEDFTLYFLNESRRGYCMHFASAAALLLREMGIPARYVSGYVTRTVVPGRVDVADRSAHAWVEVYLDGYGWYPVEVTPGYQGDALPWVAGAGTPTPTPSAKPSATPRPSATTKPSMAPRPSGTPGPGTAEQSPAFDLRLLLLPAAALSLILCAALGRYVAGTLRRRRLRQENANAAVIACYRYALRLARHGGQVPPVVAGLAGQAAFSRDGVTPAQARTARQEVTAEAKRLRASLSRPRRFLLRWFWWLD